MTTFKLPPLFLCLLIVFQLLTASCSKSEGGDEYVYENAAYLSLSDLSNLNAQNSLPEEDRWVITDKTGTGISISDAGDFEPLHEAILKASQDSREIEVILLNFAEVPEWSLAYCEGLAYVTAPKAKKICDRAFQGSSFKALNAPNVTSLGDYSEEAPLFGATIEEIKFNSNDFIFENGVLYNKFKNTIFYVSPDKTGTFTALDAVRRIGYGAFVAADVSTVNLPYVTIIESAAFASCINMTTISAPRLSRVNNQAFVWCSKLATVNFPKITYIESNIFRFCKQLSTLTLGTSAKFEYFNQYAFSGEDGTDPSDITLNTGDVNAEYVNTTSNTLNVSNGGFNDSFKKINIVD